jgi:hypothetical protein
MRKRIWVASLAGISVLFLVLASPIPGSAAQRTFTPPMQYTGDMYVLVKSSGKQEGGAVAIAPFHNCSFKIIWGPWETKAVEPMSGIGKVKWMSHTLAIKFRKKQKDQVPLTVQVIGCIPDSIELYTGRPEGNIRAFTPRWQKRPSH